jgi:hypothetical protein
MRDYLKLLEHSYAMSDYDHRLEWLGGALFNFTTYDGSLDRKFATKAVEVCKAINEGDTFSYIDSNDENYLWFIIMCNMPFFEHRLNWGTSIRGAWFDPYPLTTIALWEGDTQLLSPIIFTDEEWSQFMVAIEKFATLEGDVSLGDRHDH